MNNFHVKLLIKSLELINWHLKNIEVYKEPLARGQTKPTVQINSTPVVEDRMMKVLQNKNMSIEWFSAVKF